MNDHEHGGKWNPEPWLEVVCVAVFILAAIVLVLLVSWVNQWFLTVPV